MENLKEKIKQMKENNPTIREIFDNPEKYKKENEEITKAINDFIGNFKIFNKNLTDMIISGITNLKTNCQKTLEECNKKSWFISPEPDMMFSIKKDEIDSYMLDHFSKNIILCEKIIKHRFSKKSRQVEELFKLYRKKKYYGAIVLIFTFIDSSVENFNIFTKVGKIKTKINDKNSILFFQLKHLVGCAGYLKLDISMSGETMESLPELNRHKIIHGYGKDGYGTKDNFLKLLSLLIYLISIDKALKEYNI